MDQDNLAYNSNVDNNLIDNEDNTVPQSNETLGNTNVSGSTTPPVDSIPSTKPNNLVNIDLNAPEEVKDPPPTLGLENKGEDNYVPLDEDGPRIPEFFTSLYDQLDFDESSGIKNEVDFVQKLNTDKGFAEHIRNTLTPDTDEFDFSNQIHGNIYGDSILLDPNISDNATFIQGTQEDPAYLAKLLNKSRVKAIDPDEDYFRKFLGIRDFVEPYLTDGVNQIVKDPDDPNKYAVVYADGKYTTFTDVENQGFIKNKNAFVQNSISQAAVGAVSSLVGLAWGTVEALAGKNLTEEESKKLSVIPDENGNYDPELHTSPDLDFSSIFSNEVYDLGQKIKDQLIINNGTVEADNPDYKDLTLVQKALDGAAKVLEPSYWVGGIGDQGVASMLELVVPAAWLTRATKLKKVSELAIKYGAKADDFLKTGKLISKGAGLIADATVYSSINTSMESLLEGRQAFSDKVSQLQGEYVEELANGSVTEEEIQATAFAAATKSFTENTKALFLSNMVESMMYFAPLTTLGTLGKAGGFTGRVAFGGGNEGVQEVIQYGIGKYVEKAYNLDLTKKLDPTDSGSRITASTKKTGDIVLEAIKGINEDPAAMDSFISAFVLGSGTTGIAKSKELVLDVGYRLSNKKLINLVHSELLAGSDLFITKKDSSGRSYTVVNEDALLSNQEFLKELSHNVSAVEGLSENFLNNKDDIQHLMTQRFGMFIDNLYQKDGSIDVNRIKKVITKELEFNKKQFKKLGFKKNITYDDWVAVRDGGFTDAMEAFVTFREVLDESGSDNVEANSLKGSINSIVNFVTNNSTIPEVRDQINKKLTQDYFKIFTGLYSSNKLLKKHSPTLDEDGKVSNEGDPKAVTKYAKLFKTYNGLGNKNLFDLTKIKDLINREESIYIANQKDEEATVKAEDEAALNTFRKRKAKQAKAFGKKAFNRVEGLFGKKQSDEGKEKEANKQKEAVKEEIDTEAKTVDNSEKPADNVAPSGESNIVPTDKEPPNNEPPIVNGKPHKNPEIKHEGDVGEDSEDDTDSEESGVGTDVVPVKTDVVVSRTNLPAKVEEITKKITRLQDSYIRVDGNGDTNDINLHFKDVVEDINAAKEITPLERKKLLNTVEDAENRLKAGNLGILIPRDQIKTSIFTIADKDSDYKLPTNVFSKIAYKVVEAVKQLSNEGVQWIERYNKLYNKNGVFLLSGKNANVGTEVQIHDVRDATILFNIPEFTTNGLSVFNREEITIDKLFGGSDTVSLPYLNPEPNPTGDVNIPDYITIQFTRDDFKEISILVGDKVFHLHIPTWFNGTNLDSREVINAVEANLAMRKNIIEAWDKMDHTAEYPTRLVTNITYRSTGAINKVQKGEDKTNDGKSLARKDGKGNFEETFPNLKLGIKLAGNTSTLTKQDEAGVDLEAVFAGVMFYVSDNQAGDKRAISLLPKTLPEDLQHTTFEVLKYMIMGKRSETIEALEKNGINLTTNNSPNIKKIRDYLGRYLNIKSEYEAKEFNNKLIVYDTNFRVNNLNIKNPKTFTTSEKRIKEAISGLLISPNVQYFDNPEEAKLKYANTQNRVMTQNYREVILSNYTAPVEPILIDPKENVYTAFVNPILILDENFRVVQPGENDDKSSNVGADSKTTVEIENDLVKPKVTATAKTNNVKVYTKKTKPVKTTDVNRVSNESVSDYIDKLFKQDILVEVDGKKLFSLTNGRVGIITNIGGIKVPMYQSTSGTETKIRGQWYPFFGDRGAWVIKGDSVDSQIGYGFDSILQMQNFLNGNIKETDALIMSDKFTSNFRKNRSTYRDLDSSLYKGDKSVSINRKETAKIFADLLGYSLEELKGKTDFEIFKIASEKTFKDLSQQTKDIVTASGQDSLPTGASTKGEQQREENGDASSLTPINHQNDAEVTDAIDQKPETNTGSDKNRGARLRDQLLGKKDDLSVRLADVDNDKISNPYLLDDVDAYYFDKLINNIFGNFVNRYLYNPSSSDQVTIKLVMSEYKRLFDQSADALIAHINASEEIGDEAEVERMTTSAYVINTIQTRKQWEAVERNMNIKFNTLANNNEHIDLTQLDNEKEDGEKDSDQYNDLRGFMVNPKSKISIKQKLFLSSIVDANTNSGLNLQTQDEDALSNSNIRTETTYHQVDTLKGQLLNLLSLGNNSYYDLTWENVKNIIAKSNYSWKTELIDRLESESAEFRSEFINSNYLVYPNFLQILKDVTPTYGNNKTGFFGGDTSVKVVQSNYFNNVREVLINATNNFISNKNFIVDVESSGDVILNDLFYQTLDQAIADKDVGKALRLLGFANVTDETLTKEVWYSKKYPDMTIADYFLIDKKTIISKTKKRSFNTNTLHTSTFFSKLSHVLAQEGNNVVPIMNQDGSKTLSNYVTPRLFYKRIAEFQAHPERFHNTYNGNGSTRFFDIASKIRYGTVSLQAYRDAAYKAQYPEFGKYDEFAHEHIKAMFYFGSSQVHTQTPDKFKSKLWNDYIGASYQGHYLGSTYSDKNLSTLTITERLKFDGFAEFSLDNHNQGDLMDYLYKQLVQPDINRMLGINPDIKLKNFQKNLFYTVPSLNLNPKIQEILFSTEPGGLDRIQDGEIKEIILQELHDFITSKIADTATMWSKIGIGVNKNLKSNVISDSVIQEYRQNPVYTIKDQSQSEERAKKLNNDLLRDYVINNLVVQANIKATIELDPAQLSKGSPFTDVVDPNTGKNYSNESITNFINTTLDNLNKRLAYMSSPSESSRFKKEKINYAFIKDHKAKGQNIVGVANILDGKRIEKAREHNYQLYGFENSISKEEYNALDRRELVEFMINHYDKLIEAARNNTVSQESVVKYLSSNFPRSNNYFAINQADALEYVHWKHHLDYMYTTNKITKAQHDNIYDKIEKGKPLTADDNSRVFGSIKPLYAGALKSNNTDVNFYIKSSHFPLLPSMVKGHPGLEGLLKDMEANDLDRVAFESAVKIGGLSGAASIFDPITHEYNGLLGTAVKISLPSKYLGDQLNVPVKDSTKIVDQIQYRKLLGNDILNEPLTITDPAVMAMLDMNPDDIANVGQLMDKRVELYKNLFSIDHQELVDKITDGKGQLDLEKLYELIKKEMDLRNYSINERQLIDIITNEDVPTFQIPLYLHSNPKKIEGLIASIINQGGVTGMKRSGRGDVQAPSLGFFSIENIGAIEGGITYVPDYSGAPRYMDTDKHQVVELIVPWNYKEDISNFTNEDGTIDYDKLPAKLLRGIGFRIPNQAHASIIPFKIVGFLPKEYPNTIIVPTEIVKQMGSDFDIDKLYSYLPSSKLSYKSEYLTSEFQSKLDIVNEHYDLVEANAQEITNYAVANKLKTNDSGEYSNLTFEQHSDINQLRKKHINTSIELYDELYNEYNSYLAEVAKVQEAQNQIEFDKLANNAKLEANNALVDILSSEKAVKLFANSKVTIDSLESILNQLDLTLEQKELLLGQELQEQSTDSLVDVLEKPVIDIVSLSNEEAVVKGSKYKIAETKLEQEVNDVKELINCLWQ